MNSQLLKAGRLKNPLDFMMLLKDCQLPPMGEIFAPPAKTQNNEPPEGAWFKVGIFILMPLVKIGFVEFHAHPREYT